MRIESITHLMHNSCLASPEYVIDTLFNTFYWELPRPPTSKLPHLLYIFSFYILNADFEKKQGNWL